MTPPPIIKKPISFDSPLKVKFDDQIKKENVNKKEKVGGPKNHLENWTFVGQDEKELIKN